MSRRPALAPAKLRIWQQNARKSQAAHHHILTADPSLYDIIMVQEPWLDHLGKTRGNNYWRVLYPSNYYLDGRADIRSIILINTNINTDAYTQLDILHSDITAIRLKGDFGHCSLFNIYNDCTNNSTLTALSTYLSTNIHIARPSPLDYMFWMGDFNRHHPLWEEARNRTLFSSEAMVEPLLDLLDTYGMIQTLPVGIPTYETANHNWTRPDNVWRTNNADDPIIECDVDASIRPPRADHLPIITVLDLPITRSAAPPSRNMREADFAKINEKLKARLDDKCPAKLISNSEEFDDIVNTFVDTINEVLDEEVPITRPSPFTKRWWTKELTDLKREKNRLSNLSYKFRDIPDAPVHTAHKDAINKFCERLDETKKTHWVDWLESATSQDIYIANKYISSEPSDYSSARIPSLKTGDSFTTTNDEKAEELAKAFFPPPPTNPIIPQTAYPEPLKGNRYFSRDRIREVAKQLSPYKAPGNDRIQNVVLQKCMDVIIDHLYFIFRAILELDVYPSRWLSLLTIVLRKPGKPAYNVAKAYRPIGLLDTIGKLFSTLIAHDLSFLAEKHQLLPPTQFGGRPGRCTTDAMHLIVQKIKDAWRAGKVASALFLDIQAAFPNTVKERLLHNLRSRRVPTKYVRLIERMLTGRTTLLKFDDFISKPIDIINGTTQGCPLSMLIYAFYNADLIDIAKGKDETSSGFVDDGAFVAVSDTLDQTRSILKDMMERNHGGFDWSFDQNSPFELSKLAIMDYPRTVRDIPSHQLILHRRNPDNTITTQTVTNVTSYKYLGVHFDPKLKWGEHIPKVVASATWWSQQIWRISKTTGGLSPSKVRQLYNTVAIPAFTYAADVWYIPPFKPAGHEKYSGSVAPTKAFTSVQRRIARYITGGINGTAGDVLEVHANILPIDLLFRKVQFRATSRICTLPSTHPLYAISRRVANHFVKRHRSPLHYLFYLYRLSPNNVETILPARRRPTYKPSFDITVSDSKDSALTLANRSNQEHQTRIYCDGSGYKGGIGAAAVLYIGDEIRDVMHYHLGPDTEHTVYEGEVVGISLGLKMLHKLNRQLTDTIIIGLDNQAALKALKNQKPKSGHYLLDEVHNAAEALHAKQDKLFNARQYRETRARGAVWRPSTRNVIDIQLQWVPGHMEFQPNEKADEEAKKAALGLSSPQKDLPRFLRKQLPASVSALRQQANQGLQRRWARQWKTSPRYTRLRSIDNTAPSKKFLTLVKPLSRKQASILTQLRTGRIGLNQWLFRIQRSDTPSCPYCQGITVETIRHFLFECPQYQRERHIFERKLRRHSRDLPYILSHPNATQPLLQYVHSTGRLKATFGAVVPDA